MTLAKIIHVPHITLLTHLATLERLRLKSFYGTCTTFSQNEIFIDSAENGGTWRARWCLFRNLNRLEAFQFSAQTAVAIFGAIHVRSWQNFPIAMANKRLYIKTII